MTSALIRCQTSATVSRVCGAIRRRLHVRSQREFSLAIYSTVSPSTTLFSFSFSPGATDVSPRVSIPWGMCRTLSRLRLPLASLPYIRYIVFPLPSTLERKSKKLAEKLGFSTGNPISILPRNNHLEIFSIALHWFVLRPVYIDNSWRDYGNWDLKVESHPCDSTRRGVYILDAFWWVADIAVWSSWFNLRRGFKPGFKFGVIYCEGRFAGGRPPPGPQSFPLLVDVDANTLSRVTN